MHVSPRLGVVAALTGAFLLSSTAVALAEAASDEEAVRAALAEYRAAYEARDPVRLKRIWQMNELEDLLVGRTLTDCQKIALSVAEGDVSIQGRKAAIDFDQEVSFSSCPRGDAVRHSELRAHLIRDDQGGWVIEEIEGRGEPTPPVSAAPGLLARALNAGERAALTTLGDYRTALETCDVLDLSRVWVMTGAERRAMDTVCERSPQLTVTIAEREIDVEGTRAAIQFDQRVTLPTRRGDWSTSSSLVASLIRASGGEWTIWKIERATEY